MKSPIALRLGLFAVGAAVACTSSPVAFADAGPTQTTLGGQADVGTGQMWTVSALKPSADVIAYQPAGKLWEATATVAPVNGGNPLVPGFSARVGADSYPVLWPVPTALGVNPSGLAPGQTATGKLYFDVVGQAPTSVTYTLDGQDTAIWVQPPPPPAAGTGYSPAPMTGAGTSTAPATTPAATGSSGTPLPATGSQGTPLPAENSATTPGPAAGSSGTPATGSSGTPATGTEPSAAEATSPAASPSPTPSGSAGTPATTAAPAGSAGTPAAAPTTTATVPAS